MKGTIFHRGNKLKDRIIRAMAWFRVRKFWVLMPKKEYKTSLFYMITGMFFWLIAVPVGLYAAVVFVVIPTIEDLCTTKKTTSETAEAA